MNQFIQASRIAEAYNLGGGRENSVSILEAFSLILQLSGKRCAMSTWIRTGKAIISVISPI
jgi:hypothetical protein